MVSMFGQAWRGHVSGPLQFCWLAAGWLAGWAPPLSSSRDPGSLACHSTSHLELTLLRKALCTSDVGSLRSSTYLHACRRLRSINAVRGRRRLLEICRLFAWPFDRKCAVPATPLPNLTSRYLSLALSPAANGAAIETQNLHIPLDSVPPDHPMGFSSSPQLHRLLEHTFFESIGTCLSPRPVLSRCCPAAP